MSATVAMTTLLVPDYESGIAFYRDVLGLRLVADTPLGGGKRWVVLEGNGALGVSAARSLPLRVRAALDRRRIESALRVIDPLHWLGAHPHAGRWRILWTAWIEARRVRAALR